MSKSKQLELCDRWGEYCEMVLANPPEDSDPEHGHQHELLVCGLVQEVGNILATIYSRHELGKEAAMEDMKGVASDCLKYVVWLVEEGYAYVSESPSHECAMSSLLAQIGLAVLSGQSMNLRLLLSVLEANGVDIAERVATEMEEENFMTKVCEEWEAQDEEKRDEEYSNRWM